jgi:hypothetical protein
MQSLNLSPVDQILNATSRKFDAELDGCDALVIPTNAMAYGKAFFRVTDNEILMLDADGNVWDEYDMPEDGDVVECVKSLLSSVGF